jgi:hypothetical protein
VLACLGLLDDAAPLFCSGAHIPYGGVLLALPALVTRSNMNIAHLLVVSRIPREWPIRVHRYIFRNHRQYILRQEFSAQFRDFKSPREGSYGTMAFFVHRKAAEQAAFVYLIKAVQKACINIYRRQPQRRKEREAFPKFYFIFFKLLCALCVFAVILY